jgi:hypothetical protein
MVKRLAKGTPQRSAMMPWVVREIHVLKTPPTITLKRGFRRFRFVSLGKMNFE